MWWSQFSWSVLQPSLDLSGISIFKKNGFHCGPSHVQCGALYQSEENIMALSYLWAQMSNVIIFLDPTTHCISQNVVRTHYISERCISRINHSHRYSLLLISRGTHSEYIERYEWFLVLTKFAGRNFRCKWRSHWLTMEIFVQPQFSRDCLPSLYTFSDVWLYIWYCVPGRAQVVRLVMRCRVTPGSLRGSSTSNGYELQRIELFDDDTKYLRSLE